ncbi:hypothetical protein FIBSPDRAFT_864787 [Athelia psychrophila]|uniref:Uncharacterized protein n=1 Tax=Athelia psychrophila TaxID=1759441 RepID=A0A166G942_9AGAM|nr:hypothetical protein FIBSPDRAFT_864787 [Fibularhizoctonia sp. CBS 109695]
MNTHTLVFRPNAEGELCTGFKYDMDVLKNLLFPALPSRKRRKLSEPDDNGMEVDGDAEAADEVPLQQDVEKLRGIVLEGVTDQILLLPTSAAVRQYDVLKVAEGDATPTEATECKITDPLKPLEPPAEAKPAPPTWSTPPAEIDRTASFKKSSSPLVSKSSEAARTVARRVRASTKALVKGRGQEHIQFFADGVSIEGLDTDSESGRVQVVNWRWALPDEFAVA